MRSLLTLTMFALPALFAAASDGPDHTSQTATLRRKPLAPSNAASIRINVNMALVPVTVTDPHGRNVLGLERENFHVFDGAEQPIASFGTQDAPISVGLIFDCSKSMTEKFRTARLAPAELYHRLNPEDESFLVTVADRAELRTSVTSNFTDIQNALLFVNPKGTTSLIDGVYLGLTRLRHARNPRRALVVVSDGGDNNSRYSPHDLAVLAAESDTQIFSICLYEKPSTQEEVDGPEFLSQLAQMSGGVSYLTRGVNDLRTAMAQAGAALHNQYVLGYYPPEQIAPGKFRKIKVKLALPTGVPKLQVFARTSYYVPDNR